MSPIDIFIVALAVSAVIGAIVCAVIRKKRGKSLNCDCSSCNGNCGNCSSSQEQEK